MPKQQKRPSSRAPEGEGGKRKRRKKSPSQQVRVLRDIPPDDRVSEVDHSAGGGVWDRRADGMKRRLPGNEVAVMQWNELAAEDGQGYFFHLPSRDSWKKNPREARRPASRNPSVPDALYPTAVFMQFSWSLGARTAFFEDTHRGRYLKSSAILNPPPALAPLFPIQYIPTSSTPIWKTPQPSLIVVETGSCFYLLDTEEASRVLGLWNIARSRPSGPSLEARLEWCPYLWESAVRIGGGVITAQVRAMQQYRLSTIREVYDAIVHRSGLGGKLLPSMTTEELAHHIPRPLAPEEGVALGTPLRERGVNAVVVAFPSANPPTRRGVGRMRKPKAGDLGEAGAETIDAQETEADEVEYMERRDGGNDEDDYDSDGDDNSFDEDDDGGIN